MAYARKGGIYYYTKILILTKNISITQTKTTSVALMYCLNIGVDPPDVVKIEPCARMECWIGTQKFSD
jgi:hypothetical protein